MPNLASKPIVLGMDLAHLQAAILFRIDRGISDRLLHLTDRRGLRKTGAARSDVLLAPGCIALHPLINTTPKSHATSPHDLGL
jgi:hypothetical protein